MQPRWLKKQLSDSSKLSSSIAGMWDKANGDVIDFVKKIQASGGIIESASVHVNPPCKGLSHVHVSPPCQGFSTGPGATNEELAVATDGKADEREEGTQETAKEEGAGKATEADVSKEEPQGEKAAESPAAIHDESFLSDAEGSIAEAIGRT